MRRMILTLLTCFSLAACNVAGELDPSTQEKLANALRVTCPFVEPLKTVTANAPEGVHTALFVMEAHCPPNSPPTNVYAILAVIAAAVTLRPYIHRTAHA